MAKKRDGLNSIIGRLEDARTTAEEARDSTDMKRKDEALKEIKKTLADVIDDLELRVDEHVK